MIDVRGTADVSPTLITLAVLALFSNSPVGEAANRSLQPTVSLVINARAWMRPDEIARATVEITRILGAIGVRVDWIAGAASVADRLDNRLEPDYAIHVIVLARTDRPDADALPLGFAPPETTLCDAAIVIFKEHVDEFAHAHGRPASLILGLVIAHEIGHVLLPKPAHTSAGIMQSPWDQQTMTQADNPGLQFTAQQGALIRATRRRCLFLH